MQQSRPPAVAGTFYEKNPDVLSNQIDDFLAAAPQRDYAIKALIVPHAGYVYSGPIAARGYSLLHDPGQFSRVVLLGPAHYVYVEGIAVPSVDTFTTPLGEIPLETDTLSELARLPQVQYHDDAHAPEHSLEVQLPFLQRCLSHFSLVPLLIGNASAAQVAEVLEQVWGGPETLLLISSDLSHFHSYGEAQQIDSETSRAICDQSEILDGGQACGCHSINGLMHAIKPRNMQVVELDLRNSGDTAGPKDRVVGYGAYAIF